MRLYRILLYLFPTAFRHEYGEEMCWIFNQRRRDASTTLAMLSLWIQTFWEVATNSIHVHWDILQQDLRYTFRTLRRTPGFTLAAIIVTALGVGATTAAFSITDHVLIRSLPFRESKRPGFFATLRIPLQQGRDVSESDTEKSALVAVVSESFVQKYWPNQNALGLKFEIAFRERTIVGVVGDIRVRRLEQTSEPQVYLPHQQVPDGAIIYYTPKDLLIRSTNALSLLPAVRQIIRNADPDQPISDVQMLTDIVEGETAPRGTQLRVIGAFAGIAVLLAGIGIHGLLSYAVSQRTQEFGVRIALGAQSSEILKLALREGIHLAATGIFFGAVLAYAAGRAMEALLAGVKPADPGTFLTAIGLSMIMTIAGSLLPANRAVRVNPTTAIRAE